MDYEAVMAMLVQKCQEEAGSPFMAAIFDERLGEILATGRNASRIDKTRHGEMEAIAEGVRRGISNWSELTLVTTAEPCARVPYCGRDSNASFMALQSPLYRNWVGGKSNCLRLPSPRKHRLLPVTLSVASCDLNAINCLFAKANSGCACHDLRQLGGTEGHQQECPATRYDQDFRTLVPIEGLPWIQRCNSFWNHHANEWED